MYLHVNYNFLQYSKDLENAPQIKKKHNSKFIKMFFLYKAVHS